MRRVGRDRGAADALGLVLIAPAAIGLAVLVIALGRDVDARAQVRSAAAAGAQAAALERTAADAERATRRVVGAMLGGDGCRQPAITVVYPPVPAATSGISSGTVEVTVRCTVSNRGIELVRPDDRTQVATATASIDFFRAGDEP